MDNSEQPAFPFVASDSNVNNQGGLTKREYFAAMAIQGLLANPNIGNDANRVVVDSIELADILLEQLEEKKGGGDEKNL
jgi:hypothetical protein